LRQRIVQAAWQLGDERYSINAAAQNLVRIFEDASLNLELPPKPLVLIVNVFYPPQAIGGATRVVHDNVRYLSTAYKDDFRIEVFTTVYGKPHDYEISCYVQDGVRVTARARPADSAIDSAVVDSRVAEVFGKFLEEICPSLIHFHCVQPLVLAVAGPSKVGNFARANLDLGRFGCASCPLCKASVAIDQPLAGFAGLIDLDEQAIFPCRNPHQEHRDLLSQEEA
jgi:hypothetical protein